MPALLLYMIPPAAAALYTGAYGLWAWRRGLTRGAVGLFVLACATLALPAYLLLVRG